MATRDQWLPFHLLPRRWLDIVGVLTPTATHRDVDWHASAVSTAGYVAAAAGTAAAVTATTIAAAATAARTDLTLLPRKHHTIAPRISGACSHRDYTLSVHIITKCQ